MHSLAFTELAVIITILGFLLLLGLIPAVLAFIVLSRVPAPYRKQEPALAFLLLIPIFSLVWMFFVHPRVAASLKAYYDAQGPHPHGDCGGGLALAMCICTLGPIIPFAGPFVGLAALVLLIAFYVKAFQLSAGIRSPL